jgi:hypothetical protein
MNQIKKTGQKPLVCFWSLEYIDDEGETVIKHMVATPSQMKNMIDKFANQGVSAKAYQIKVDDT